MEAKACSGCGEIKPPSMFNMDASKRDGLTCRCVDCRRSQNKEWMRKKRIQDPQYGSWWAKNNKERVREIIRDFERRNPNRRKKWVEKNKERYKAILRNYRARKRNAPGRITGEQVSEVLRLQKWRCAACKSDIRGKHTIDHIVPLSRGGENIRANLQAMCRPCNSSKNAKSQEEFFASRGYLL